MGMDSIIISDVEDSKATRPAWCGDEEKIIKLSMQNQSENPAKYFGDKRNLIINIKKVIRPRSTMKDPFACNWAKEDLLGEEENCKYLQFMGWI